ncbi:probable ADP-ribosylation factor GTPase-activating protein AGD15 [Jatropha curcas]|uniref:probable ADP-ribosylation factor GTPase-activating protein AGD15 n=1 Tax=Jatropha curcas TaxID=180498 RepID=UPI00189598D2|nr:probable ADP-ribosylation factor GTPase-activating protein AGD15 [Jatropha curcas]
MNGKASVSKELSAKHTKILEGLLKLAENKECADCKSKAPRWASINLGIFICLQCSGIHRRLGVHISQMAMGNEKSNQYWEARLPPEYNRSEIEKFIPAKYEEKRWVSRRDKSHIPKQTRSHSLDEGFFSKYNELYPPPKTNSRGVSLDRRSNENGIVKPKEQLETYIKKAESDGDLFGLLHAHQQLDTFNVIPAPWAIFD